MLAVTEQKPSEPILCGPHTFTMSLPRLPSHSLFTCFKASQWSCPLPQEALGRDCSCTSFPLWKVPHRDSSDLRGGIRSNRPNPCSQYSSFLSLDHIIHLPMPRVTKLQNGFSGISIKFMALFLCPLSAVSYPDPCC